MEATLNKSTASERGDLLALSYFTPEGWRHPNGTFAPYEPTPAQRKAMSFIRAQVSAIMLMGGKGRKTLLLYEPGDPVSKSWATLMLTRRTVSHEQARAAVAAAESR